MEHCFHDNDSLMGFTLSERAETYDGGTCCWCGEHKIVRIMHKILISGHGPYALTRKTEVIDNSREECPKRNMADVQ